MEHPGPVAGFGAACSGLDSHVGIFGVRGGVEKRDELEGFEVPGEAVEGCARFAGGVEIIEFLGEFDARGEVGIFFLKLEKGVQLVLVELGLGQDIAGLILIIPEPGIGGLAFEVGNFVGQQRDVKDTS